MVQQTADESPDPKDDTNKEEDNIQAESKSDMVKVSDVDESSEQNKGAASPVFEQSAHKGSELKSEETQTDL